MRRDPRFFLLFPLAAAAAVGPARGLPSQSTASPAVTAPGEATNPPTLRFGSLLGITEPDEPIAADPEKNTPVSDLWESHHDLILGAAGVIVVQAFLIVALIGSRRRARETDASLNLAAEAADIGLWQRQADTTVVTANSRWRILFDLPATGTLTMDDVLERIHPDDRPHLVSAVDESSRHGQPFSLEHRIVQSDGSTRWISTHGRAEPGPNGQSYGTRGASRDITHRREADAITQQQRQQLAHLSRVSSLGVLSGALAHELNQPLGIIVSNAQAAEFLLESEAPDLDEMRNIISDIIHEGRRGGEVIRRLRSLLQSGETTLETVDVNACVSAMLQLTHSDLIARHVKTVTYLDKELPDALADPVQLQQILLNLILNACDAMEGNPPDDRQLTLATCHSEEEIFIAVSDCGVGLPEEVEQLFDPFHSSKPQGLGMGLAICRALVTAHHGRLWAVSNPERGATFHIVLPNPAFQK